MNSDQSQNISVSEIAFKEKSQHEQFYLNESGEWIKCDENKIASLWEVWVSHPMAKEQYEDSEGFTRFEFNTN